METIILVQVIIFFIIFFLITSNISNMLLPYLTADFRHNIPSVYSEFPLIPDICAFKTKENNEDARPDSAVHYFISGQKPPPAEHPLILMAV
jgi:hypothetical protein